MTPDQLRDWITQHCKGNKALAARELGITRASLDTYLSGVAPVTGKPRPIPKYISLACQALSLQWMRNTP